MNKVLKKMQACHAVCYNLPLWAYHEEGSERLVGCVEPKVNSDIADDVISSWMANVYYSMITVLVVNIYVI